MISLRLYLENIAGDWYGWIEDYAGALVPGESPQAVERAAPQYLIHYLTWLETNGERVSDVLKATLDADYAITIVETIPVPSPTLWEARHFMESDGVQLSRQQLEQQIQLLSLSRAKLMNAIGSIPPHEWDGAPLGGRSIREALQQIVETESNLLGRIGAETTNRLHPDPLISLDRTRTLLEAAAHDARDRTEPPQLKTDRVRWSVQKALRLAHWNEIRMTAQIAVRSDPVAYMRFMQTRTVVRRRDDTERAEHPVSSRDGDEMTARHTHATAYYY